MLSPEEIRTLRTLLSRAEVSAAGTGLAGVPVIGDLAQIHPLAHPTFGGMLIWIAQIGDRQVRGSLLRPHRGGCREAWLSLPPTSVELIGRIHWPDPEFTRRCEANYLPECRYGHRGDPASECASNSPQLPATGTDRS